MCGFSDIVDYIKRPPSTISYHIKRLRDAEIINSIRGRNQNQNQLYRVSEKDSIRNPISKYKQSFLFFMNESTFADNFNGLMDEI